MTEHRVTPAALVFVVCRALADQGPLDVNGFPVDGVKLDYGTCRNEVVQIYDRTEGLQHASKSRPVASECLLAHVDDGDGQLGEESSRLVRPPGEVPASRRHLPRRHRRLGA